MYDAPRNSISNLNDVIFSTLNNSNIFMEYYFLLKDLKTITLTELSAFPIFSVFWFHETE